MCSSSVGTAEAAAVEPLSQGRAEVPMTTLCRCLGGVTAVPNAPGALGTAQLQQTELAAEEALPHPQGRPGVVLCAGTLAGSVMSSVPQGSSSPSSPLWPLAAASSRRSCTNCSVVRKSRGRLFWICSLNLTTGTKRHCRGGVSCCTAAQQGTAVNPRGFCFAGTQSCQHHHLHKGQHGRLTEPLPWKRDGKGQNHLYRK